MVRQRSWTSGLRGIYITTCQGNINDGLSGCIWGNIIIILLIIFPLLWPHSEHYMVMMLLHLLIWHLGIIGLPNPRIGSRRVKKSSILLNKIYRWPIINIIYMNISTGSSTFLKWETWYSWDYNHTESIQWRKVSHKILIHAFMDPTWWFTELAGYLMSWSCRKQVIFTTCFTFHASRRNWANRSLLRHSYSHLMRMGS